MLLTQFSPNKFSSSSFSYLLPYHASPNQQYFVSGDTLDCGSWEHDFENCVKFEEEKDEEAAKKIIESEKERRKDRMKGHFGNNVWKKRGQPPEDWNKPLPDHISKSYENSYLDVKNKEMKGECWWTRLSGGVEQSPSSHHCSSEWRVIILAITKKYHRRHHPFSLCSFLSVSLQACPCRMKRWVARYSRTHSAR